MLCRELFIRHALVEGDWETHHQFFAENRKLLDADRGDREPGPPPRHPGRRRDGVRASTTPGSRPTWCPARHFDAWWKKARRTDPDLLTFTRDLLVNAGRDAVDPNAYPDAWLADGVRLPLSYSFEPDSPGRRRHRAGAR